MESTALQSVVCTEVLELLGLPQSHLCRAISGGPLWFSLGTGPRCRLRKRVHPLVSFILLQSSSNHRLLVASPHRAPSLGFRPYSRHQHSESTCRWVPKPTFVPPAAFLALSTVYSSCCLTGLFRPVATSWIRSPGGFPISQPLWFIARASRLVVSRHSPTGEQALLLQLVPPRLHGFDSGCWSVATYRCFTPVCNSIPS